MEKNGAANIFLLLGTNLGNKAQNLKDAIRFLAEKEVQTIRQSAVVETPPWGFESTESFYNQVIQVTYSSTPESLLQLVLAVEQEMGRERKQGARYSDRLIDIDILLFGNTTVDNASLTIPHPRMHERRFTLFPLSQIAQNIQHPTLQVSIPELLKQCTDTTEIKIVAE